jgi:stage V sporulation protein B
LTPERTGRDVYLRGAFILAGAAMFSRLLGAVYRIPLSRVMGDYAMGLYGAGYSIYTTLIGISTLGINVAISKVMAEKIATGDERGAHRVFRVSLWLLAGLGLVFALALGLAARPLAVYVMGNPDAYYAILALAPALFFVALEGSFRGYFQGYQRMAAPAMSQLVEQFFRVGSVLILAFALLARGDAIAAGGAAFGASIGAGAGALYLLVPYFLSRRDVGRRLVHSGPPRSVQEPIGALIRRIVVLAIPISIAGVVIPLMGVIDLFVVPLRLQAIGYSTHAATALYGQLSQFAMTLINLPAVVTYGLQTSLVPAISEAQTLKDTAGIRGQTSIGMRATILVALPAFLGLWLLAGPICGLLYKHPEAGVSLAAVSAATLFLMLQQTTSGVLQGLGRTDIPVRNLIIGAVVKAILAWVLVGVPALNIRGGAYSTVAGFLVASVLNLVAVQRLVGLSIDWPSTIFKPLTASALMGGVIYLGFPYLALALGANLATLAMVALGGLVYGLTLLALGGVSERDFTFLPGIGPRVVRVLRKARLIRG